MKDRESKSFFGRLAQPTHFRPTWRELDAPPVAVSRVGAKVRLS